MPLIDFFNDMRWPLRDSVFSTFLNIFERDLICLLFHISFWTNASAQNASALFSGKYCKILLKI